MKKLIKNYTTEVPLEKTIMEIQKLLAGNGATGIMFDYDGKGKLTAVFFRIAVEEKLLHFRLPAKPQQVYDTLFARMQYEDRLKEERMKKAEQIAWRICKLWLEAQIGIDPVPRTPEHWGHSKSSERSFGCQGQNLNIHQSSRQRPYKWSALRTDPSHKSPRILGSQVPL